MTVTPRCGTCHMARGPVTPRRKATHTYQCERQEAICCQCVSTSPPLRTQPLRMPHRSKKEKGSSKKVPPATQLMRVKPPGSHSATRKEKRFSTSSFPLSTNRELQKLPALTA
uniref:serine/threonine-protein phosphatase 2A 56 kDa regulatory subunit delta isoform-like n=1 Tax=Solea senegalensis TaxID=28829 RepID=UPI001CD8A30D|nr:serine/threonine-protein phosphatase 2A 56 kDa regulatory subunit delta isoform-like [Solea senegalensis]